MLTAGQRLIAARIIETGHCELSSASSGDYIAAAAFIFDEGIFYLPGSTRAALVAKLRNAGQAALKEQGDDG
jgi:hypothetical protein